MGRYPLTWAEKKLQASELDQNGNKNTRYDKLFMMKNFDPNYQFIKIEATWGRNNRDDSRLQDDSDMADSFKHSTDTRNGAI